MMQKTSLAGQDTTEIIHQSLAFEITKIQESIPVGCVPFAAVTVVEGLPSRMVVYLPRGVVPAQGCTCLLVFLSGGCTCPGGVPAKGVPAGECVTARGGGVPTRGVPTWGGVPARGCIYPGVYLLGGVPAQWCVSQHALRQTPPL